jgi:hypothetical protein
MLCAPILHSLGGDSFIRANNAIDGNVIVAFLMAVFMVGWFIGPRERRRGQRGEG